MNITGDAATRSYSCDRSSAPQYGNQIHFENFSLPAAPSGSGSLKMDACISAGSRIMIEVKYLFTGIGPQFYIDSVSISI